MPDRRRMHAHASRIATLADAVPGQLARQDKRSHGRRPASQPARGLGHRYRFLGVFVVWREAGEMDHGVCLFGAGLPRPRLGQIRGRAWSGQQHILAGRCPVDDFLDDAHGDNADAGRAQPFALAHFC